MTNMLSIKHIIERQIPMQLNFAVSFCASTKPNTHMIWLSMDFFSLGSQNYNLKEGILSQFKTKHNSLKELKAITLSAY